MISRLCPAVVVDGARQSVSSSTRPAIRLKEPKNGTPGPVNASVNPWRARAEHVAHVLPTLLWPGVSLSGGSTTNRPYASASHVLDSAAVALTHQ